MNQSAFSPASPGLRVLRPLPSSSPSAIVSIVSLVAETLSEETAAREALAARVKIVEAENLALRASVAALSARFEDLLSIVRGDAQSPPRVPTSKVLARKSQTPIRTL